MNEDKKIYTIHKQNSLIRANLKNYNLQQLKFLNAIYHLVQKDYRNIKKNNYKLSVKYSKLIDLMGYDTLKSNPISKIINESKILLEPLILNKKDTKLIKSISIQNEEYRNVLDITVSKKFIKLAKEKTNWTKIDLSFLNSAKSLFQYRLYEYLKSYNNLKSRKLVLYFEDYINIFETNNIYFSNMILKINRAINFINDISDLDIEVIYNKKNNLIVFNFKNKTDIEIKSLLKNDKIMNDNEGIANRILKNIS